MTSTINRRDFVIGAALGITGLASAALAGRGSTNRLAQGVSLDKLVPEKIGSWSRSHYEPMLIPKGEEPEGKSYDSVITRYYVSASALPVMLLIAYGSAQTGETQLHRPEICYVAAGFKMRSWPNVILQGPGRKIAARLLTATAPGRTDQILYWTRVGEEFPTTSVEQRWSTLRQTLTGSIPDGVLVRISIADEDREAAMKFMTLFTGELLASGSRQLQGLLEGIA
jgi:EpsI family protein